MPTVTPVDDGVPDFSSLISEQLANLENGLTVGFERLALEREGSLRAENKQLQQENKELRAQLKTAEVVATPTRPSEAGLVSKLAGGALQALSNAANAVEASAAAAEEVLAEDLANMSKGLELQALNDGSAAATPLKTTKTDSNVSHSFIVPSFALLPEYGGDTWMMNSIANDDEVDAGYCAKSATPRPPQHVPVGVVDPSSSLRLAWDLIGIPVLSWDLITIPMGVYDMGPRGGDIMAGAGWVTLIYWTIDMPCTFLTGFFDSDGNVVMNHKEIARTYLHGFFGLDLTIVVADWLSVIMEIISGAGGGGFLANVSVLRIFRITRFARLLRLKKLKAKIQTIEDSIQSEWWLVIMGLFGKVTSILMLNHYVSCLWFWIGSQSAFGSDSQRWTSALPYPQYDHGGHKFIEAPWAYQYLTSLHWAIAQFTPGPQNIQPQNCVERIFAVFVLLFGLVIFSSFIAGVTQARMQLNKMMSKLDRDLWVLRKFCQQNKVSRELNMRMKRYVDLVIVPNYHKLTQVDVVLIPKLSAHLRAQLKNELVSQIICIHPFFNRLRRWYDNVMNVVSQTCIENTPLASGDVAFGHGQVATCMHIVTKGVLDYLPAGSRETVMKVEKGRWVSEAAMWTKWVHQGQLQASIESSATLIDSNSMRREIVKNGLAMGFVRKYSQEFLQRLNKMAQDQGCHPGDIHDEITADIAIGTFLHESLGVPPKFT